jgi:hypothetical protein
MTKIFISFSRHTTTQKPIYRPSPYPTRAIGTHVRPRIAAARVTQFVGVKEKNAHYHANRRCRYKYLRSPDMQGEQQK